MPSCRVTLLCKESLGVVMITPRYPPVLGGNERQAHNLARQLVQQGIRVFSVTGNSIEALPTYEEMDGVPVFVSHLRHRVSCAGFDFCQH